MAVFTQRRLDVITTVAILVTCGLVIYGNWSRIFPPTPSQLIPETPVSTAGAFFKGDPRAPIVLVEWTDYECPYCGKFEREVLPQIDQEYIQSGRVQLAILQHPLTRLHPHADESARTAVCAGRQGKFWQMHASLFRGQKQLDHQSLSNRVQDLGLDAATFDRCMAEDSGAAVRAQVERAEALGLTGTPAFLVGTLQPDGSVKVSAVLKGARSLADFEKAIGPARP